MDDVGGVDYSWNAISISEKGKLNIFEKIFNKKKRERERESEKEREKIHFLSKSTSPLDMARLWHFSSFSIFFPCIFFFSRALGLVSSPTVFFSLPVSFSLSLLLSFLRFPNSLSMDDPALSVPFVSVSLVKSGAFSPRNEYCNRVDWSIRMVGDVYVMFVSNWSN